MVVEEGLSEAVVGGAVAAVAQEEGGLDGAAVGILEYRIEYALDVVSVLGGEHAAERQTDHHGRVVELDAARSLRVRALAQR